MKKEYEKVLIQVIEYHVADIVTASEPGDDMFGDDIEW